MQVVGELLGVLVPAQRVFAKSFETDRLQVQGKIEDLSSRPPRLGPEDLVSGVERLVEREQFVQGRPQAPNVGSRVQPADLIVCAGFHPAIAGCCRQPLG